MLAMQIGLRPAARACNLDEHRVLKWAQRGKWGIGNVAPALRGYAAAQSSKVLNPIEAVGNIVQHYGDRAKIGAVIAGSKALEHLADCEGSKLVTPAAAISGDQWTKAVDRAAGWTQARQQGVNVGVAVTINPPSAEERAERRAVHASLDAITKLLQSPKET